MRWLLRCGLVLGMAAGAHPAPAIAAQAADGPGCIGVMAEECVRWLRATMTIDENFLVGSMAHRHETDVNGPAAATGEFTLRQQACFTDTITVGGLRPDTRYFYKLWTDPAHSRPRWTRAAQSRTQSSCSSSPLSVRSPAQLLQIREDLHQLFVADVSARDRRHLGAAVPDDSAHLPVRRPFS